MKNNRSFTTMLSVIWMSLTGGFRSKAFRRAIGLLLVTSMFLSSTGMVLAKELDDEMSDPSTGIVTELTEESSSEPSDETSEEEPSEETSSDTEKTTDTSDTSDPSDTSDESESLTDETSDISDTSDISSDTENSEIPSDTEDTEAPAESTDSLQDGMIPGIAMTDPSVASELDKTEKTFRGDSYSVAVSYGPETGIPEDAELVVHEITESAERDEY